MVKILLALQDARNMTDETIKTVTDKTFIEQPFGQIKKMLSKWQLYNKNILNLLIRVLDL